MQSERPFARPWLQTAVSITLTLLTITRLLASHNGVRADIATLLSFFAVRNSSLIYNLLSVVGFETHRNVVLACASIALVYKLLPRSNAGSTSPRDHKSNISSNERTMLEPLLLPCQTTHIRLFPHKHSFSYSYLLAGIPIGWTGQAGKLLSSGGATGEAGDSGRKETWFNVVDQDYLRRGSHPQGLSGKLQEYLKTQKIDPSRYPYAYLVTAPRFGGFSFNPVSFWYLYSREKSLGAMILEVNNTFDERRIYYLEADRAAESSVKEVKTFRQTWLKDFHVSPFNDRDGSYSVTSSDPFSPNLGGVGNVDVNIVLSSPEGQPKIVARVFSDGFPVDPQATSNFAALIFVMRWWWVGFMTNPRILREARKLWSNGLQVFYRPEVLLGSIGRQETTEEAIIEKEFSRLLKESATDLPCSIVYTAAAGPYCGLKQRFGVESSPPNLEINVLTPSFYSELARSSNAIRVIKQLAFTGPEKERMLYVSNDKLCETVISLYQSQGLVQSKPRSTPNLSFFNIAKSHTAFNVFSSEPSLVNTNQQPSQYSELDHFVLTSSSNPHNYLIATSTIILSDALALSYIALLNLYGKIILFAACYYGATVLSIDMNQAGPWEEGVWSGTRLLPMILVLVVRWYTRYV